MTKNVFFLCYILIYCSHNIGTKTIVDKMKLAFSYSLFLCGLLSEVSAMDDYVVSFDRSFKGVDDALAEADAKVQRQLTCTRGVVASLSEEGKETLQTYEGVKVLPLNGDHHGHPTPVARALRGPEGGDQMGRNGGSREPSRSGSDFSCGQCPPPPRNGGAFELTVADIDLIKNEIKSNLALGEGSYAGSLTNSIGELLRLVFHDASAFDLSVSNLSGLNGCVDLNFPANNGLHSALTFLEVLRSSLKDDRNIKISRADMHVLGAMAAIEQAGGPVMPFKYGRRDVDCSCEDNFFPDPESEAAKTGTGELDTTMRDSTIFITL